LASGNQVTDAHIKWYSLRAGAGPSLVIVEASGVSPDGLILSNQIGLWDDKFLPGLARLADSIHSSGAKAIIQLVHAGGRSWRGNGDGSPRLAPSELRLAPGNAPKEMDDSDIQSTLSNFIASAQRAKTAGFDGIEVHGAHYYLFSQFLSPLTNLRTDKWGKGLEGRSRFLLDTIKGIRNVVGADFIISCRMHAVELLEGGMSADDSVQLAKLLEGAGADLINASAIGSGSWEIVDGQKCLQATSVPPDTGEPGIYVPYAQKLKEACGLPVIAVGRLAEPGAAEMALNQGIDLVAIARQLIADPQAPKKLLEGRSSDINPCQKCLNCFKTMRTGGIECPVYAGSL
jgi:2,4-dienoyl-CoA reductase-like NADH-dependent reductase (Old Yellow Enzyme family)